MCSHHITPFLLTAITLLAGGISTVDSYVKNNDFDIFIFTQHWPITTCIDWEARFAENTCSPHPVTTFTVHGLWPTQFGKIAPIYCNNTWHFNKDEVKPIMEELTQYWPDYEVRNVSSSLWDHEWRKHGTCAASLPAFDSEFKYFQAGVHLAMQNPIGLWLQQRNIMPGGEYTKAEIWEAVIQNTKTRPHIDCEQLFNQQYIKEIKLCFNKSLAPMDCDGIVQQSGTVGDKFLGTCHDNMKVYFPNWDGDAYGHPTLITALSVIFGVILLLGVIKVIRMMMPKRRGYESI